MTLSKNPHQLLLPLVLWLAAHLFAHAFDPSSVRGVVAVEVDRSKPVWAITVTNQSAEKLSYEMIGKVPRGLGLEVWGSGEDDTAFRVHAEDLAEYLNVDGFPADLREILPGKSATFQINPKSMSATDIETFLKWKKINEDGYYTCRVVFGIYSSRLMEVSPPKNPSKKKSPTPPREAKIKPDSTSKELYGLQLRQILNDQGLALVSWHRGTDSKGEPYVHLTTCPKAEFDKMAPWDGTQKLEPSLSQLTIEARTIARQVIKNCELDDLAISSCQDDFSKRYVTFWFSHDRDDTSVKLLLNGAPTTSQKINITPEHEEELAKYGIPKQVKKD